MKRQVFLSYNIPWETRANYEVDHRIPRALLGGDLVENLWPEPLGEAKHFKDPLEVKLHKLVCTRDIPLSLAQQAFFGDWTLAYKRFIGPLPD